MKTYIVQTFNPEISGWVNENDEYGIAYEFINLSNAKSFARLLNRTSSMIRSSSGEYISPYN